MNNKSKKQDTAIALSFSKGLDASPKVSALGNNNNVALMKKIARRYNIPIKSSDDLLALLSETNQGDVIPESAYREIAKLFLKLK